MNKSQSLFSLKRLIWHKAYMSEINVATRDAIPARMMVALASLVPVPPPDTPSGMIGKNRCASIHLFKGRPWY
jgi:hypothetical protein